MTYNPVEPPHHKWLRAGAKMVVFGWGAKTTMNAFRNAQIERERQFQVLREAEERAAREAEERIRRIEELRKSATDAERGTPGNIADELTKLVQLRDAGVLSPEEFDQAKAKLLG
jgi:hypothetical protein